jgi:hypothetical protein
VGDGDDDQGDEEPEPVAGSTDASSGTRADQFACVPLRRVRAGEPPVGDGDHDQDEQHRRVVQRRRRPVDTQGGSWDAVCGGASAAQTYCIQHDRLMVFDMMEKDRTAIRLYEMLGCTRIGTIEHDAGDGTMHPAAVYVAPTEPSELLGPLT